MKLVREKNPNILVADDDLDDQDLIRQALKETLPNVSIDCVYNGIQLMNFLNSDGEKRPPINPDLILLDINMPLMNGFKALKQMRDYGILERIPVYMLSTSNSKLDEKVAFELGARGFITKPLTYGELKDALAGACSETILAD